MPTKESQLAKRGVGVEWGALATLNLRGTPRGEPTKRLIGEQISVVTTAQQLEFNGG
jgi:hypothetical protein